MLATNAGDPHSDRVEVNEGEHSAEVAVRLSGGIKVPGSNEYGTSLRKAVPELDKEAIVDVMGVPGNDPTGKVGDNPAVIPLRRRGGKNCSGTFTAIAAAAAAAAAAKYGLFAFVSEKGVTGEAPVNAN